MTTGRWAVLILGLSIGAGAVVEIAARAETTQVPSCGAALVRYDWNREAAGAPWIAVGPRRQRLEAWLYSYDGQLADARVNRSERLVLYAGKEHKIGWYSRKWGGSWLTIVGNRLDAPGSFRQRFRAAHGTGAYPSGLRIPASGCWQLTLRTKGWVRRLVVEAIESPAERACDATPVPESGFAVLTPQRSGIVAGWGWRTPEGGALLYAGGRTPEGGNTKVLWRTTRDASFASGELTLWGKQLDGTGMLRQTLSEVTPRGHWPSIVAVPNSGCWLLTARIGGLPGAAGIIVARVI